jgi:hypothetical protein
VDFFCGGGTEKSALTKVKQGLKRTLKEGAVELL